MKKIKKAIRQMKQYFKHPIVGLKFEMVMFVLAYKAAFIKTMYKEGFYLNATKLAKEQQPRLDKAANLLARLFDTDWNHVRIEINPNVKYGIICYVND